MKRNFKFFIFFKNDSNIFYQKRNVLMEVIGIDLAGSEKRDTGICVLSEKLEAKCFIVHKDEEILELVEKFKPKLIAIDAPLSLPKGRKSLDRREKIHFRECDRKLLELGIKFFPITLGPMRTLTKRGIRLRRILKRKGYKVIEVYPGATQDILKIARKSVSLKKLREGLEKLGIKIENRELTHDELDAITAAFTGYLHLSKKTLNLGDPKEGIIVIPHPKFK
jgi:predicted nuclease with RNAse H fold